MLQEHIWRETYRLSYVRHFWRLLKRKNARYYYYAANLRKRNRPNRDIEKGSIVPRKQWDLIVHVPNALAINGCIARIMGTLTDEYKLSPYDIEVAGRRRSYDKKLLVSDIDQLGQRSRRRVIFFLRCCRRLRWIGSCETDCGGGIWMGPSWRRDSKRLESGILSRVLRNWKRIL